MLSTEYDMFARGMVVRLDEVVKDANPDELSNFAGSGNKPTTSEEREGAGRDLWSIPERAFSEEPKSSQSESESESGTSQSSTSSISSSLGGGSKYELTGSKPRTRYN